MEIKQYEVIIQYRGTCTYIVDAHSAVGAKQLALARYEDGEIGDNPSVDHEERTGEVVTVLVGGAK